jgi:hypothetical protein
VSGFPLPWLNIRISCSDAPLSPCAQESPGSPKSLTFLSTHPTLFGPRQTLRALTICALFVLASGPLTPSPSAFRELSLSLSIEAVLFTSLGGLRSPLRATWFPVYASIVSFGSFLELLGPLASSFSSPFPVECLNSPVLELRNYFLLHDCNTRYGWVVSPCPLGTLTPKETPS